MKPRTWTLLIAGLVMARAALALDLRDLGGLGASAMVEKPRTAPAEWVLDRPIDAAAYRLGPGDRVGLFAYNLERSREDLLVESDGRLELPGLGRVPAAGLSLAELRIQVGQRLARIFACDSVDLWIAQPRRIRVLVSGEEQQPRWLELDYQSRLSATLMEPERVPPLTDPDATLPALLKDAPAEESLAWRNVVIERDGERFSADLLLAVRGGDLTGNPVLEGGDRVIWSRRGAVLQAWGPFRHEEGLQEFRPGDTPARLIALMGGPREGLGGVRYEVVRSAPDGRISSRWSLAPEDPLLGSLSLQPHDRLYLRVDEEQDPVQQVKVGGQVRRPGNFAIDAGVTTLADVLALAAPDSATADLAHILVLRRLDHDPEARFIGEIMQLGELYRFERDYLKSRILHEGGRVSMTYDGDYFDPARVPVLDGDEIRVLRRSRDVEVLGAVNRPGTMHWRQGWTARDYVKAAGGKLRGANLAELRLRRAGASQFTPLTRSYEPEPGDVLMLMYREEMTAWQKFKEGIGILAEVLTIVLVARTI